MTMTELLNRWVQLTSQRSAAAKTSNADACQQWQYRVTPDGHPFYDLDHPEG